MSQGDAFIEPLRELAQNAYEISGRLCGACRDLHALWPYIRLSRASTGVEQAGSRLQLALRKFIAEGRRDILIAGSQDAGLFALVARAGAGHAPNITVLDICATPLELCRGLAKGWSLPVETIRQDLCDLNSERRFDLVLVHGTLQFIAAERRTEALRRIRRALRPGGRLILLFNTSSPVTPKKSNTDYGRLVLAELKRLGVPLPDKETVMLERLDAHQTRRELREGAFADPRDIEPLLQASGLSLLDCTGLDVDVAEPISNLIAKTSKRRFMALAEPKCVT